MWKHPGNVHSYVIGAPNTVSARNGSNSLIQTPLTAPTSAVWRSKSLPAPISSGFWKSILSRIFALSPILHLNGTEALEYTRKPSIEEAAHTLYEKTGNSVIITLGEQGAYCRTADKAAFIPGIRAEQTDTIGAGDSHIGTVIARLKQGASMERAIADANRVAAAVVETSGALLSDEAFQALGI